jgi:hypothetical protein
MRHLRIGMWLTTMTAIAALTAGGCESTPTADDAHDDLARIPATPVAILEMVHGDISGVESMGVMLITSPEQLIMLNSATLAALNIDFNERSLVLLALGQQTTGGYWARITNITQYGDTLVVDGLANRPEPGAIVPQVITTPYCVAVTPVIDAARVRQQITSVTGQMPPGE